MRRLLALVAVAGLACSTVSLARERTGVEPPKDAAPVTKEAAAQSHRATVQLAILLDTSNSMDGLIAQAKSQVWSIVNTLATAKQKGERPSLQVALYEYGNDSLSKETGFIRQVLPLTTDLDEVSAKLFSLTTNGGEEYCAQVIAAATSNLAWSASPDDLKIILIAGNEPFTQGTVDYHATVPVAVKKGIIVNTIFCGAEQEGVTTMWKDGAQLGEGKYSFINTNAVDTFIPSPFDKDIESLGTQLNSTYIAYGAAGESGRSNQIAQDSNAVAAAPGAAVQRAVSKSSALYTNSRWDLIDAVKDKKVKLEEVKGDDLPPEMKAMTVEQRKAHVEKLTKERAETQTKLGVLQQQREAFVAKEKAKAAGDKPGDTLQDAILAAIREQGERRGFVFGK